uniref:Uncharacterized protein n=1 Tax=Mus musculus TaxID=10090 RepID=Q3TDQ9_MOUSE|nr:unnamed protein product [Mus musculus]
MSQLTLIAQSAVRPHSLEKWKTVTQIPILYPPSLSLRPGNRMSCWPSLAQVTTVEGHSYKWVRLTREHCPWNFALKPGWERATGLDVCSSLLSPQAS